MLKGTITSRISYQMRDIYIICRCYRNVDTYTCKPKTTNVFNFNKQYRDLNRRKDACTFWPVMYGNAFTAMCLLCRCSDQYQKYKLYTRQFDKHSHLHHTSYLQIHDILSNWKLRIYPPPCPHKKTTKQQKQTRTKTKCAGAFGHSDFFLKLVFPLNRNKSSL